MPSEGGPGAWRVLARVEGHGTTDRPRRYAFVTDGLPPGRHAFRLRQVDFDGTAAYSAEVEVTVALDAPYRLGAVHPNPFRHDAALTLTVREAQRVRVDLYDLLGRRVAVLYDGPLAAHAPRSLVLAGRDLPAGTYLGRVEGERFGAVRTVTRVR